MIIGWHCRGCNKEGTTTVDFVDLIKTRKGEDFITLLMNWVRKNSHDCKDAEIGIKLCQ